MPDGVLAWRRTAGDDARLVAVNFGRALAAFDPGPKWVVEVASDGEDEGQPFGAQVRPDTAVVLRRVP